MASRPSLYNEERNLLRMRAWEQRNQETSQDKELNPENVPLFGEPYKTNKGDELSSRIQKMLGSYENVNNPHPILDNFTKDPSCSSTHVTFSRSSQGRPTHTDKSAMSPFHTYAQYGLAQTHSGPSNSSSQSSQLLRKPPVPEHHNHHGPSSSYSQASLNHTLGDQLSPSDPHQRKGEAWPDLRECASLRPVLSALSPPAEPLSPLHSTDPSDSEPQDMDDKDTPERHQHQGFQDHPPESLSSAMDVSPLDPQQSPRDAPLPQPNEGATLPSQTFPPPLSSKAPNIVMTQKPTAYVRPMDGQDQVVNESPELKPSPKPYETLPDLKSSKPSLSKLKMPSQSLETLSNEAQCVEDILREMTHSWPPLLTAIHTPSTAEPSKFSFPAKEAQHVPSAYPGQKHYGSPPTAPSSIGQQSSSSTVAAAHSSGVESASSSDSESSSGSESDSESGPEEPPQPLRSSSPLAKPDVPTATHGDWQLVNWIRSSQQNPSTESQGDALTSQSPTHKGLPPSQSPKATKGEVANTTEDYKPCLSPLQEEYGDNQAKPPQRKEGSNNYSQQNHHNTPSTKSSSTHSTSSSHRKTVANKHPSKTAKAPRLDDPQAGVQVESVEVVAPRDKDPTLTDRPKVKTKTSHSKSSSGPKTDSKKAAKRTSSDKRKAGSESGPRVTLVLDCKRETERMRSPSPTPAQPDQPSPAPPVKISSSNFRTETVSRKGHKKPQKSLSPPAHQPSAKRGSSAKASRAPHRPPGALLVKIELSLLSRVPRASRVSQETPSSGKKPVAGQDRGDTDASTPTKTSKKRPAEKDSKAPPKKKPKLEKEAKTSSSSHASVKSESPTKAAEEKERKKAKKGPAPLQKPPTPQDPAKSSGGHKRRSGDSQELGAGNSKDGPVKHKKSTGKRTEHSKTGKKGPKSSFAVPVLAQSAGGALTTRPLVKFEDRRHPVEHYMKEAKKLKHKADATSDKVSKAFNYLDAAMSFMESGVAMEMDPQTPKSAYTMFAETVELIRFILKLKNSMDPSAPASEKDFTVLCMKCQSLLQMAMFRYKREAALKYSKTLTDHFKSSAKSAQAPSPCVSKSTGTPSPMSDMPSPASTASSSGPGSNHSSGGGGGLVVGPTSTMVAIPQVIQQVASSYVNITSLFLSAHDIWEQAEELVHRGSGLLTELDRAMGPLNLTSSMSSVVHYMRQGLHWLRLDSRDAQ